MRADKKINKEFTDFAWGEMNKILDKEMPQKKKNRGLIFWFAGMAAAVIVISTFVLVLNSLQKEVPPEKYELETAATSSKSNALAEMNNRTVLDEETDSQNTNGGEGNNIAANEKISTIKQSPMGSSIYINSPKSETGAAKNDLVIFKGAEQPIDAESEIRISPIQIGDTPKKIIEEIEDVSSTDKVENTSTISNEPIEQVEIQVVDLDSPMSNSVIDEEVEILSEEIAELNSNKAEEKSEKESLEIIEETGEEKTSIVKSSVWHYGISTAGLFDTKFKGVREWNVAGTVEYSLSKKFALSSGLYYSTFNFLKSTSEEARASAGFPTEDEQIDLGSSPDVDSMMFDSQGGQNSLYSSRSLNAHYLGVPLVVSFKPLNFVSFNVGVGANYLLASEDKELLKKFVPFMKTGIGFHVSESLELELLYKYYSTRLKNSEEDNFDMNPDRSLNILNDESNHLIGLNMKYRF